MCQDGKRIVARFPVSPKDTESTDSTWSLDFSSNRKGFCSHDQL
jgi:hypothetical protein